MSLLGVAYPALRFGQLPSPSLVVLRDMHPIHHHFEVVQKFVQVLLVTVVDMESAREALIALSPPVVLLEEQRHADDARHNHTRVASAWPVEAERLTLVGRPTMH